MTTSPSGAQDGDLDALAMDREIERLLGKYLKHLDELDFHVMSQMMRHIDNKVLDVTAWGVDEGEEVLIGDARRDNDATLAALHYVSSASISIDRSGKRASIVGNFTARREVDGLPPQAIRTGRCQHIFVLHDGAWRLASRIVKPRLMGDARLHLSAEGRGTW